jgi:hypothetical protein
LLIALLLRVTECAVTEEGLDLIRQIALVRAALEQTGHIGIVSSVDEAKRARILCGCLAMGADCCGVFCGGARVHDDRFGVSRSLGVVRKARIVEGGAQRSQNCGVQCASAIR